MGTFPASDRTPKEHVLKSCSFLLKIAKIGIDDLMKWQ